MFNGSKIIINIFDFIGAKLEAFKDIGFTLYIINTLGGQNTPSVAQLVYRDGICDLILILLPLYNTWTVNAHDKV